jgi:putative Ca2+/H+ antiporter (TMEM165/GDT1 family)
MLLLDKKRGRAASPILVCMCLLCTCLGESTSTPASITTTNTATTSHQEQTNATEPTNKIGALLSRLDVRNKFLVATCTSLVIILVSEVGDKSFFIAAVLAMQHPRLVVFLAALLALEIMALISVLLGSFITQFVPRPVIFYASTVLFALFGLKMLYEAYYTLDEAPVEQTQRETEDAQDPLVPALANDETNNLEQQHESVGSVLVKSFLLMFCAEWGDRSQISIFVLGARQNLLGTFLGCTLGNAICTAIAVVGGRFVGQKISVRLIHLTGAFFFIGFCILDALSYYFFT